VIWALPALVLKATPYRFGPINHWLGHVATEVDYFLKKRALGGYPPMRPMLFTKAVSNPALLEIWSRHIKVRTNRLAFELMRPLALFPSLAIDVADADRGDRAVLYPLITAQWADRPPLFRLPDEMLARGRTALHQMGVPEGAWFVPVHSRDGVYKARGENKQSYRNCQIANYSAAVDAIIARGGWCVRVGAKGTEPLPPRKGLVEYPNTPYKSDWMDLFLCNQARFFLGNTSGLKLISTISGVPCAASNIVSYGVVYAPLPSDLSMPKLLRLADGRLARFADIFASDISRFGETAEYERAGVTPIENTPKEICDLAMEMLDVLDDKAQRGPEDDAREQAFRKLLSPTHYSYHARSRIGAAFLRDHADLL
jgi:putative glycosyltransferase (TIGR04372 family)